MRNLYTSTCPDTGRVFITEAGIDGNIAETFAHGGLTAEENATELSSTYMDLKWSGEGAVPAIGDSVYVKINNIGQGVVTSYFTEGGYLGVMVQPDSPPEWYVKQNGADSPAHIFGIELGMPDTVAVLRGAYNLARAFVGMHTGNGVPADLEGIFTEQDLTNADEVLSTLEGNFSLTTTQSEDLEMIIVTTDRQGNKWFIAFYGAGKRMLSETTQAMRRQGREWGMVRHGDVYTVFAKHEPEKTNLSLYERRR